MKTLQDIKNKIAAKKELKAWARGVKTEAKKESEKMRYMFLDRLKSDCNYFLGYGNGCLKHLWAGEILKQIELMKIYYNSFSLSKKPKWLKRKDIKRYKKQMLAM
ncbi:MAG: LPD11 domain-containing protein, partial [Clostridia bacterium]